MADEIHNIHGPIPRPPRVTPPNRDPPKRDRREQEQQSSHQGEDTVDLSKDAEDGQPEAEPPADSPHDAESTDGGDGEHPHIDVSV